ncbi:type I polyketide synthase, partial [Paenibacillus sp. 1-18]|uniref:type I polyketide synthase n=1 Tax=Paenibacillus sp. 1-18 TaxID=1333846 RepID=UPI00046FFC4A
MKDFFQYMLGEVKSGRMQKEDAILRIRQFQAQMPSHGITHSGAGTTRSLPDAGVLMLEPVWKEQVAFQTVAAPEFSQRLVVLCELDHISERSIEALMKGARCIKLHASQSGMDERFQAYALQLLTEVQKILKENLRSSVLIQIAASSQSGQQPFVGLLGLLKAAEKENPKIVGQFVELESSGLEGMVEKLNENSQYPKDKRIWYEDGKRLVLGWNEMNPPETTGRAPWKNRGIYLITGGAGGLGLVFAKDIARRVREATLVLVGRSMPDEGKQAILEELKAQGARAEYRQVDISRKEEVSRLVLEIREEYGGLDGVLHSAGVIQDRFIIHKTQEEFVGVLAPKVAGLVNLDQATKEQNLDFFIFFSSIAGIMGNPGQADYSAANAFMDAYASYRNSLAASKERKGQTLSVNWPLWKDGGMQVNDDTEKAWKNIGMVAMQSSNGVKALYDGLAAGLNQVLVIEGELSRLRKHILEPQPQEKVHVEESASSEVTLQLLLEKTLHQLKLLFGEVTKLSIDKIDVSEPLESYGIDSIMITRLNQKLQGIFGEISMTLFYEYQTLEAVAEYFIADYHKECVRWTGLGSQQKPKAKFVSISAALDVASELSLSTLPKEEKHHHRVRNTATDKGRVEHEPIAIIGISGRYPQAKNMEEYWSNLEQGKDCITEIPAGRWKREGFYCPDIKEAVEKGKSYSKSGGFVEDFADFDPLFFNISPREAMSMDPQERIFLEECWKVFEDAGYSREQLAAQYHGRIGVFAGITGTGFNLYGPKLWEQGHPVFPRTSFSSVANRISYFLNLKGPSMPIDTMCSSSLTAIHEACEHIYNGECEMAVAGGVNLYLHPSSYIFLSTMRMLSPEGRCKSFGEGGNGFVPGEGAGVVLLKPLSRAIADKDHIYAVIRGTRINHGGKTNGYTVPNPVAQGELIREAFDKAGVNARAVSYIEAHGTGTELGDPIEITGLTQAFRKDTQDTGFCAVGSVKSNIGHLEAAAGIAGIAKIILQMKNRKIVPSLHSQKLNSNINFAKTPFVVQQRLSEWERPIVEEDGEKREYPRIAGISSFGAGGANAHIVLEEYLPAEQDDFETSFTPQRPVVIVLSAKSDGALKEQASQLAAAMDRNGFFDHDLVDVAYTLQTGREAMEERLAVVVESVEELRNKLMEFIGGRQNIAQLYRGQAKRDKESLDRVSGEEVLDETVDLRILAEKYGRIAELWADGAHMDWGRLYGDVQPRRIPLPTYPFARERYWIDVDEGKPADGAAAHLHPLLYQNTFVPSEQSSNSTISGQELTQKYVIDLRDEAGQVCERIKGDSCKEADTCENTPAAIMLQPCWKEQAASDNPMAPIYERHVVMLCETNTITAEELGALFPGVECITLQSGMEEADRRFEMYAVQVFENIKGILNDKPKGKVLVQIVTMPQNEKLLFAGLSGILKTAQKENPKIHGQLIEVEGTKKTEGLIEILKTSSRHPEDSRIRFAEGKRWVPVWSKVEIPPSETAGIPWKNCGVYLITGGARGLGLIFAKEIARQAREVTLVLTGRSLLEQDKQTSLEELKALGARVEYRQVDVTRKEAVVGLIENIRQTYGGINGILHSAGIIQDNYIIKKTSQEFRAVLAPKVAGLVNLDQASKNIALDFFILFSSGSGVGGNAGQSDYAAANAFMDAYAWYRNILVSSKERIGKTLSINWPLWKDGGMRLDQETEKAMQKVGMYAMRTETGINALYQSIACISNQVMVIEGDIELVSKMMVMEGQLEQSGKATRDQVKGSEGAIVSSTAKKAESGRREDLLREKTVHHLK